MRRTIKMSASESFYNRLDLERKILQSKYGIKKISIPSMTEILVRNFPKIQINPMTGRGGKRCLRTKKVM